MSTNDNNSDDNISSKKKSNSIMDDHIDNTNSPIAISSTTNKKSTTNEEDALLTEAEKWMSIAEQSKSVPPVEEDDDMNNNEIEVTYETSPPRVLPPVPPIMTTNTTNEDNEYKSYRQSLNDDNEGGGEDLSPMNRKRIPQPFHPEESSEVKASVSFQEPLHSPKPTEYLTAGNTNYTMSPLTPDGGGGRTMTTAPNTSSLLTPCINTSNSKSVSDGGSGVSPKGGASHSVITIEHSLPSRDNDSKASTAVARNVSAFFLGMSKPVFMGVACIVLLSSGLAGFGLFRGFGLGEEVDTLKSEVNRLEVQVAQFDDTVQELEDQVDTLEALNTNLSTTVDDLQQTNNELNTTANALNISIQNLTALNVEFANQIDTLNNVSTTLNDTVLDLSLQNTNLNATITNLTSVNNELNATVEELQDTKDNLTTTNLLLNNEIDNLTTTIDELNLTNTNLQTANLQLNGEITSLQTTNLELENNIDTLEKILMDWYNNSSTPPQESFDEVISQLSSIIDTNRNLVITNLRLTYEQTIDAWLCSYLSFFAGEDFLDTPRDPINDELLYNEIISHISRNALQPLCLYNTTNFNNYIRYETLNNENTTEEPLYTLVSSNMIRQSVQRYTSDAIDYYFSSEITIEDWAEAQYNCNNLNSTYVWIREDEENEI